MSRRTIWQLVAFVGALALVFGGGFLIGDRVPAIAVAQEAAGHDGDDAAAGMGEVGDMDEMDEMGENIGGAADHGAETTGHGNETAEHGGETGAHGSETGGHGGETGGHGGGHAAAVGVAVEQDGYLLHLMSDPVLPAGASTVRFHILDADGAPVTDYVRKHEKDLHLILVSADLAEFHHVHPSIDEGGEWSVPVNLLARGSWRMYADFTPAGSDQGLVLSTLLTVAGEVAPQPLPEPSATAAVDGYDVTLSGHPDAGQSAALTFTVSRDGAGVDDLDPYLGADGHLVAIRAGDLAYLHTHPSDPEPTGGPEIDFATTFPTPGSYRVFLDFSHTGTVHTAAFTVVVEGHHR